MATATRVQFYGTGKRKTSIARVYLRPGSGSITINDRAFDDYFGGNAVLKNVARQAFAVTETGERFDVVAVLNGGGVSAQATALRHGIARALCASDAAFRPALKKAGMLSRDARIKERKKYGQKGARRRFQFSKR